MARHHTYLHDADAHEDGNGADYDEAEVPAVVEADADASEERGDDLEEGGDADTGRLKTRARTA